MWPMDGSHMGWMGLWWIVGLLLLVALIWAMTRMAVPPSGPPPSRGDDTPEAVLKRRYARGEIDDEEFERRLARIRK